MTDINKEFSLATKIMKLKLGQDKVLFEDVANYLVQHNKELNDLIEESDKLRRHFLVTQIEYHKSAIEILKKKLEDI